MGQAAAGRQRDGRGGLLGHTAGAGGVNQGCPEWLLGAKSEDKGLTLSPSDKRWGRCYGTLGLEEEDRAKDYFCDVPQGEDLSPRAHPRPGAEDHNLSPAFSLGTSPGAGRGTQGLELVQSLLGHTTRLTEAMEIPVTARWLAGSSYPHTDKTFSPRQPPSPHKTNRMQDCHGVARIGVHRHVRVAPGQEAAATMRPPLALQAAPWQVEPRQCLLVIIHFTRGRGPQR